MAFNCRRARFYLEARVAAPSDAQLEGGKRSLARMRQALKQDMMGETLIHNGSARVLYSAAQSTGEQEARTINSGWTIRRYSWA
jgi:hypothetical protein